VSGIFKLTGKIQYKKNVINPSLQEADKFAINEPVSEQAIPFSSVRLN